MKEHKECRYLLDLLSDFIDGTLSSELCNEIERHMADCENCRIVVELATQNHIPVPRDRCASSGS